MVALSALAVPTSAAPSTNLNDQLTVESGNTTAFGGGEQFLIKFGQDAAFGLVWGTDENPNNIYVVSYMSSYLGYIDVYNAQGNLIEDNHVVKVYNMAAVQMQDIIEFNDTNGDGQVFYWRTPGASGQFDVYNQLPAILHPETIYKKVDLNTAWEASEPVYSEVGGNRTWEITLTAHDLNYAAIEEGTDVEVGDGMLNNLSLTFHLSANSVHVEDINVPQYNVNVTAGGWFYNLHEGQDEAFSGNITSYNAKWDKEIEGWDFDLNNANPTLMVEFGSFVGTYVPPAALGIMALNQYERMIDAMGEGAAVQVNTGTEVRYNESTSISLITEEHFALKSPRLTFGGDKSRVGVFDWVQNCTVDGVNMQSHSQITGIWPVGAMSWDGKLFTGFVTLSGISYPGGAEIIQDPEVSSEAVTDLAETGTHTTNPNSFPAGLVMLGVVGAAVVVAAVLLVRGKGGQNGPVTYEKKDEEKDKNDWSQYYEKK